MKILYNNGMIASASGLKSELLRSDGKMVSVNFIKRDGSLRKMTIKKSDMTRFVNPNADPVRSAAATRVTDENPLLMRVMAYENSGVCRMIDLDRVVSYRVNGRTNYVRRRGNRFEVRYGS